MCQVCSQEGVTILKTHRRILFREGAKVSHYIINVSQDASISIYKIGDKTFSNMKELLTFYKQRLLDTSPLIRIVSRNR